MNHQFSQPIRIELPFDPEGGSVNVYLFVEPEPVLIDAGYNSAVAWDALQHGLAAHNLRAADLQRVIITHPHVDHYGLAARIARAGRAQVWMANRGVQWLYEFPAQQQRRIEYYREVFLPALGLTPGATQQFLAWMQGVRTKWEPIPTERIVSFALDEPLALGGLDWQVLHLPGHDSHLTAFYQPQTRQLLAADALIIPTATAVVDAPPAGKPRALALPQMTNSLERLAALAVDIVYPGHGAPFADHRTVIARQLARIEQRTEECWRYVRAGVETAAELFARLYGERAASVGPAGLWMVVGYLDRLVVSGRATLHEVDGVWRYQAQ